MVLNSYSTRISLRSLVVAKQWASMTPSGCFGSSLVLTLISVQPVLLSWALWNWWLDCFIGCDWHRLYSSWLFSCQPVCCQTPRICFDCHWVLLQDRCNQSSEIACNRSLWPDGGKWAPRSSSYTETWYLEYQSDALHELSLRWYRFLLLSWSDSGRWFG